MNNIFNSKQNLTDVGGHRPRTVKDVRTAKSLQDVREIVIDAKSKKYPIYPISTGFNWGMGSRIPIKDETTIVDLKQMNQIRTLDLERGYAVIEPGVTQRQLSKTLEGTNWMLNVTASCADSSVVGNALDRGDGTIRARSEDILGVEAVLADGSVVTTGGLDQKNYYSGRTAGPDFTQMFVQSNLGIVTAMAISLIPRPESIYLYYARFRKDFFPKVFQSLVQLYRVGLPTTGMIRLRELYLVPETGSYLLPNGADPEHFVILIPLLGTPETVKISEQMLIRKLHSLDGYAGARFLDAKNTPKNDPLYVRAQLAQGIPTCLPIRRGLRLDSCDVDNGSMGFLCFLPLIGLNATSPITALQQLQQSVNEHPTALAAEFNFISSHTANMVIQISFERSEEAIKRAHAMRHSARQKFIESGAFPYRSNIDHIENEILDRGEELHHLHAIKKLLDPQDIISPGRYLNTRDIK
ncbi:4-cresol dehydrogenase (hydroxylating) [Seinonella peptonophila]|uniref:4-cresol dehydrogenase (Hydroxylating) n=1 Tax=Seinonella peptonophila TaxID=112248 RepID=A0A1M4TZA9_9BACL|nr:FAD-binding oxidoreductase [Seinonella peptonophila]SHE49677.1 4-cresol dehydrogenase (hydroxylating) [Seinonella peptonophila]